MGEGTMAGDRVTTDQVTGTVPMRVSKQIRAHALVRGCSMSDIVREVMVEWVENNPVDLDMLMRELGMLEDQHADEKADAENNHGAG